MKVLREFKLMGGRIDFQYVSHIDSKGFPVGYDKKIELALELTDWQTQRVVSGLNSIGAKYTTQ